jgi:hypothetical protein
MARWMTEYEVRKRRQASLEVLEEERHRREQRLAEFLEKQRAQVPGLYLGRKVKTV